MWPGIRPATGWMAYDTSTPRVLQQIGEGMHVVLCLGDRHPVPGHEDDLVRIAEHHGDVVHGRGADLAVGIPADACARSGGSELAERTEEHVRDRPVHRPAHHDREEGSRRADEHAAHDQDVVLERESGGRRREPGECVQQRNHDGHVCAADREDEEDPEERRTTDQRPDQPLLLGTGGDGDSSGEQGGEEKTVDDLLQRVGDRPSADQLLQLRERDHRAGEGDAADDRRERDRRADVDLERSRIGCVQVEFGERDQRGRTAADAVEERDHLRHRRHAHLARSDGAERAADDHADDDLPVAVDVLLEEGDDDRDEHPGGTNLIAPSRCSRVRQEPQRQDERHDRDQIEEIRDLATQR